MATTAVVDLLGDILTVARECPKTIAAQAYVRAARELCNKSRWLTDNVSVTTEIDTQIYTLAPNDVVHEIIGINAMSLQTSAGDFETITEVYSGAWDPNDATDQPEVYQYLPHGRFGLHPTPSGAWPLLVTVALQPLRDASAIDTRLLADWEYALQAGALAWLLALPRTPWVDKAQAVMYHERFRDQCNQARSSAERGYNAGAAVTDRLGDNSGAIRTRVLPI